MKFELIEEKAGLKLIKLNIFNDERGKYIKLFSKEELKTLGIENEFVDDNYLISKKGSIRGLHCQIKNPEAKLLSCIEGKILDIVVDLRETSDTYKQFFTFELDSKENKILYIPEGFAHGFLSLEDSKVIYKSSNYYFAEEIKHLPYDIIHSILKRNDFIHLTLCTDVFHITSAPGVSAPQTFGVDPRNALPLLKIIARYSKNLTIDVAEINPSYDYDDRTSRLMANIIYELILCHFE